jgi:hypothetical protein
MDINALEFFVTLENASLNKCNKMLACLNNLFKYEVE